VTGDDNEDQGDQEGNATKPTGWCASWVDDPPMNKK